MQVSRRSWALLPAALLGLLALPAAAAQASIGVGIQAGPVILNGAAHPGGSYQLPPVYVVNTGTQQESVVLRVERISPGHGLTVPPRWIQVTGPAVRLAQNQSARIRLELRVPGNARPGPYFSDVVVQGSGTLAAGRANLGVAAATSLEFTVARGAVSRSWLSLPGWAWPTLAGLLLLGLAVAAFRGSGLRIRIDRAPTAAGPSPGQGGTDVA